MALFIAVLGGVAVAEVHRAITKGGNEDVEVLKQKEEALKQQLKVCVLMQNQKYFATLSASPVAKHPLSSFSNRKFKISLRRQRRSAS